MKATTILFVTTSVVFTNLSLEGAAVMPELTLLNVDPVVESENGDPKIVLATPPTERNWAVLGMGRSASVLVGGQGVL